MDNQINTNKTESEKLQDAQVEEVQGGIHLIISPRNSIQNVISTTTNDITDSERQNI